jgi:hypothetical protein
VNELAAHVKSEVGRTEPLLGMMHREPPTVVVGNRALAVLRLLFGEPFEFALVHHTDAPADVMRRFKHDYAVTLTHQGRRAGQSGDAGTDNDHVSVVSGGKRQDVFEVGMLFPREGHIVGRAPAFSKEDGRVHGGACRNCTAETRERGGDLSSAEIPDCAAGHGRLHESFVLHESGLVTWQALQNARCVVGRHEPTAERSVILALTFIPCTKRCSPLRSSPA